MISPRLTIGIHILTNLASTSCGAATSGSIARDVNANCPSVRRCLGLLRDAGIVESRGGSDDVWRLRVEPWRITLLDVHRAVTPHGGAVAPRAGSPHPTCPVDRGIRAVVEEVLGEVQQWRDDELGRTTVAGVLASVAG